MARDRLQNWRLPLLRPVARGRPRASRSSTPKIRSIRGCRALLQARPALRPARRFTRAVRDFDEVLRLNPRDPRRSTTAAGRAR
jgi:hypothetical protein